MVFIAPYLQRRKFIQLIRDLFRETKTDGDRSWASLQSS